MDDIERKLALIDAQLAGGAGSLKRVLSTAPLLSPALGLVGGILIQSLLRGQQSNGAPLIWLWIILLMLGAGSALALFMFSKRDTFHSHAPLLLAACAILCFVCLGSIRLVVFNRLEPNNIRNLVGDQRELATVRGEIITEPRVDNQQWAFAQLRYSDPGSSFYLKVREVKSIDGWAAVTGTVRVRVDEPVPDLRAGDFVRLYCWLDRFKGPTNPGQFNTAKYLARRNIFVGASVKSREGIELSNARRPGLFVRLKNTLSRKAHQALLSGPTSDDSNLGLLEALLLGDRRNINRDTYEAFRRTGLLHLISLSGMHLGILMGVIWFLCRTAGLLKRSRALVCALAVGLFLLVVPPRAPTIRAAIMCWVFCASLIFHRRPSHFNTLALAGIILLLIRPTQLFEAGWQLSFASVLGILLLTEPIYLFLCEKTASLAWHKEGAKKKLRFNVILSTGRYALSLLSVGLGAWLGGAGILLYHFYTINTLTSVFTVIVFPFVSAILTVGFAKIILSFVLPSLALVLHTVLQALTCCLVRIVSQVADLASGQVLIGHVPVWLILLYYVLVAFALLAKFQRPTTKKIVCTALVLVVAASVGWTKWNRTHRDHLILTCLDVGHGQAILVQLPGTDNLLFDAGSLNRSDVGGRIVAPFLDYSGIGRLNAINISHNDADHINGICEIVKSHKVEAVCAYDGFLQVLDHWGTARFLRETLRSQGYEILSLDHRSAKTARATVEHLWPTDGICRDDSISDNDKSLVTLIEFAGKRALLCSDIEEFGQKQLLRKYPNLKADIVVLPHHGSLSTLEPDFVKALGPEIVICSCSRTSYQKNRVATFGQRPKCLYTPRDGCITLRLSSDGRITTATFLNGQSL